jgi:four helix bundle protein
LPNTQAGKHIAGQLLRCGTSPAPNYGEARGAESKNDFVHKLGIVLKELNESAIWLEMIIRSSMLQKELVAKIIGECSELSKIIASSIRTVGKKRVFASDTQDHPQHLTEPRTAKVMRQTGTPVWFATG